MLRAELTSVSGRAQEHNVEFPGSSHVFLRLLPMVRNVFELRFRSQEELHGVFPRRTCNRKRQRKPAYFGTCDLDGLYVTFTFFSFFLVLYRALCAERISSISIFEVLEEVTLHHIHA